MRGVMRGVLVLAAALSLQFAAQAHAAYPGHNGDFTYSALTGQPGLLAINIFRGDGANLGAGATQLTHYQRPEDPSNAENPAWSPDGTRIAYTEHVNRGVVVRVMDADGSNDRVVERARDTSVPAWSPDGKRIAFISNFGLTTVNVDGVPDRDYLGYLGGFEPEWSPDGDTIAFECGFPHICLIPAEGGTPEEIAVGFDPEWSPDGRKIAFTKSDVPYARGDIWVMDPDGTNQVQLTNHPAHEDKAAWSPDGRKIAFVTNRFLAGPNDPPDRPFPGIWTMNADGSDQKHVIITAFAVDWQPVPNRPPDCTSLSVSPDMLWPPNGKLRPVALSGITDPDGDPVSLEVLAVTQDEPVRGPGDRTSPDAELNGLADLRLRAERSPRGDGRVYGIEVSATDSFGGNCRQTVKVTVPRKKKQPAIESPDSFDSFAR